MRRPVRVRRPQPHASPTEIMKQLFASFILGDNAGAMELVHPEGEWFFPGDPRILPWAGTWKGAELEDFFDACKDALHYPEYRPEEFLPVDETRVVVRGWERCIVKATGRSFDNPHIGIATIRDGLIWSWLEFADSASMHRAFEERGSLG